jgi:putative flippase GtrA
MTAAAREEPQRSSRWAEILRFAIAGAVNTAFGFGVYSGLVLLGLPVAVALLIATVIGVLFNFLTFGGFAFRRLDARRLPRFVLAYGLVYVLNLALLEGVRGLSGLGPVSGQLACLPVVAPLAYLLLRAAVFRERPND